MILSVSLPNELRALLDAEADRQKRSRSFVVAVAIRDYLARQDREAFRNSRDQTLRDNLALSPAERVRLSEALWDEFASHRPLTQPVAASFDTFEEYEQWRRRGREGAG